MECYDLPSALKGVLPFVDDASNWYVRRSRKRFWKSHNDKDKELAYRTLHYVMVRLSQVLAPFTPFLAEELYRNLTGEESVHLTDWPPVSQPDNTSTKLLEEMARTRQIITEGLAARAAAKIKVRQPLAGVTIKTKTPLVGDLERLVAEELNVKKVTSVAPDAIEVEGEQLNLSEAVTLDTQITPELKAEGLARDLIRLIQEARKKAGYNVEDRIKLHLESDSPEITEAIDQFQTDIFAETLAIEELEPAQPADYTDTVQVEGHTVSLALKRT